MRRITIAPDKVADLASVSDEKVGQLSSYLQQEFEDALSARHTIENRWRTAMRQYNGTPKNPARNIPIENAPNIEVALGAVGTDSIYAQIVDLIWNISPLITVRATNTMYVGAQKAVHRFVEYVVTNELDLRNQTDHSILDDVLLGTGCVYVPWVEEIKQTNVTKTMRRGPRAFAFPPEDVFVPGGSTAAIDDAKWLGLRFWYTKAELNLEAKRKGWNIEHCAVAGNIDMMRSERERLAGTVSNGKRQSDLYEIIDFAVLYDIDGDGINEDLHVIWDRTSRSILALAYYGYDHRPLTKMCYQIRAHQFYGMGVPEMLSSLQDAASDIFSYWAANMFLANCRMWAAPPGVLQLPMVTFPNKVIELSDPSMLKDITMADVYQSGPQALSIVMSLAERRIGTNDMSMPRPSQVLGSRTPATTSTLLFQQVNRRFTPAFDQVRFCTAGVAIQAMYRYQERLLMGDTKVEAHIVDILGPEDGLAVISVLKDKNFDEGYKIELTASSATVNREVERQNSMFLVGLLAQYYEKVIQLTTIVANPQTPKPVAEVARKIAVAAGEAIERTVRTFDQVRDPAAFVIDFESEIDAAAQGSQDQAAIMQLMTMLGQTGGQGIETPVT